MPIHHDVTREHEPPSKVRPLLPHAGVFIGLKCDRLAVGEAMLPLLVGKVSTDGTGEFRERTHGWG